jgi:hypothetical protein
VPRFVILEHDHPVLHWDLMLEVGEVLRTWRLATEPQPGQRTAAELTFDHRMFYMTYEGPVSGNRGRVTRWDRGTYTFEPSGQEVGGSPTVVRLQGERLRGIAVLERIAPEQWTFILGAEERPIASAREVV